MRAFWARAMIRGRSRAILIHRASGWTISACRKGLTQVDRQQGQLAQLAESKQLSNQQETAFNILTSGKLSQAFEMDREPATVRDRYGRTSFGQSLLLARRLIQAGVPVVQANMGRVQNWDTHDKNFPRLKSQLLPWLDQGVSALLDDLESNGLLGETLV